MYDELFSHESISKTYEHICTDTASVAQFVKLLIDTEIRFQ